MEFPCPNKQILFSSPVLASPELSGISGGPFQGTLPHAAPPWDAQDRRYVEPEDLPNYGDSESDYGALNSGWDTVPSPLIGELRRGNTKAQRNNITSIYGGVNAIAGGSDDESDASISMLSVDDSISHPELAITKPPAQPSTSRDRVDILSPRDFTHPGTGYRRRKNRRSILLAKQRRVAKQSSTLSKRGEKSAVQPTSTSTSKRAGYTAEEDAKIHQLKEQGLSWLEITEHFPGRTPGAIRVRYHNKLKPTSSRSESQKLCDYPQTRSVVDNARDEEWEVEEICDHRKLDDGSLQLLVKWKGGEETWEPYENVEETEALDEYERRHGLVIVDIV
ncbi:hypothetical protein N657DRAFT_637326 [Parathielavia appendiculata]|uniref:Chromo domain-containing protein n=1 Tax=Parathielavia appendiculata TaxID=2587402 RepID=A0AAN6TSC8_9PEZI|nr:hypothetical protein N657DRAFT_637326 [Parathielavia appendiculata]